MDTLLLTVLQTPLFAGVTPQELPALLSCLRAEKKAYAKGEVILAEGAPAGHIGIVLNGSAQVGQDDFMGYHTIIANLAPGHLFAETFAAAHIKTMPVSVVATSNCHILLIDYTRVTAVCSIGCPFHTQLIENMLAVLADKNLTLNNKLNHLAKRTMREKLLSYLNEQARQAGSLTFTIPFNRQELADYLSVDRSALSSELGRMQREGLLQFSRSQFTLAAPV
ncbi:Crp/Fnr family transcriptional regulator [Ruminococcaceae bacterium OttesenSCG-928-A16]|nr:Crp/Fnr family transcriptional regulator [Ruminococcaceae bacterium OttesenSCG-928-A16]